MISGTVAVAAHRGGGPAAADAGSLVDGVLPHARRLSAAPPAGADRGTDHDREGAGVLRVGALRGHIAGTEDQVLDALEAVVKDSAADEVLITTSTYDRVSLLDSYRRLARTAGLDRPARDGER